MSKTSILVVDDDELFLGVLKTVLEKNGFAVSACGDAQGAEHLFMMSEYDLVLSDIRLNGKISGIDLLSRFKKERPTIPFILMTGFAQIIETIQADSLGANGFLAKPFRQDALVVLIQSILKKEVLPAAEALKDEDYIKLSISDFISGKDIRYDVFVRLNSGKYIKIGNQGEDIPHEQITNYKAKGLNFLYLKKEDFKKYLDFNLKLSSVVTKSKQVDSQKKINFLKHTNELILQKVFTETVDKDLMDQGVTILGSTLEVVSENDDMLGLLEALNSHTDSLYAHSLGVALYSGMIARELSWTSMSTIAKLTFAGLFHDIGKKEIDPAILKKPRANLTPHEVQVYETHAARGMEILSQLKGISTDVMQIVLQHHEYCTGHGYPARLTRSKIHPMAKVISVANDFCKQVIASDSTQPVSPADAIERLLIYPDRYDKTILAALMKLFKFPIPQEFESKRVS
jgi:putative nucleotidyltransferase with HDIG domain